MRTQAEEGRRPLHHQLRLYLENGIASGKCRTGELLPPEPKLMEKFGVSRGTVRKAYDYNETGFEFRASILGFP